MRYPELWARLSAHEFDGGGSAPYSVKLARAQGWSAAFTAQVVEEYRRFLDLTQIGTRQVTPSRSVDAAWHMHLAFTRNCWNNLCPHVIGASVHHQPCAGEEEMPRYRDQFAATKALYEAGFGAEPPADTWARDAVPRRSYWRADAGGVRTQFIACLLLLTLGCMTVLHLLGAVEGVGAGPFLGVGGLFIVFAWLGFGPRPRRKKGTVGDGNGWYWEWPEYDDVGGSDGGGGGGDGDAGGCDGCGD